MKKSKFYVVWEGVSPGIYRTWADCQLQTKGYKGARFKSFGTIEEAQAAFASPPAEYISNRLPSGGGSACRRLAPPPSVQGDSLAVDAACSGNPGAMEYRGVHVGSGQELFHFGPVHGTNNIGEFLAIAHGLAFLQQKGLEWPVYSDSLFGIKWVKQKKCNTHLPRTDANEPLFRIIARAEKWLHEHTYNNPLLKWETEKWGEIPADFGRK